LPAVRYEDILDISFEFQDGLPVGRHPVVFGVTVKLLDPKAPKAEADRFGSPSAGDMAAEGSGAAAAASSDKLLLADWEHSRGSRAAAAAGAFISSRLSLISLYDLNGLQSTCISAVRSLFSSTSCHQIGGGLLLFQAGFHFDVFSLKSAELPLLVGQSLERVSIC